MPIVPPTHTPDTADTERAEQSTAAGRQDRPPLSYWARKLLRVIRSYLNGPVSRKKGYCYPSVDELAQDIGKSTRTVKRLIAELVAAGELIVQRPDRRYRNRYYLPEHAPTVPAPEEPLAGGDKMAPRRGQNGPTEGTKWPLLVKEEETKEIQQQSAAAAAIDSTPNPPSPPALDRDVAEHAKATVRAAGGLNAASAERLVAQCQHGPALCMAAARNYAAIVARYRRRGAEPPGVGLLMAFVTQPEEKGFSRRGNDWFGPEDAEAAPVMTSEQLWAQAAEKQRRHAALYPIPGEKTDARQA